jgi:hypothetical protein
MGKPKFRGWYKRNQRPVEPYAYDSELYGNNGGYTVNSQDLVTGAVQAVIERHGSSEILLKQMRTYAGVYKTIPVYPDHDISFWGDGGWQFLDKIKLEFLLKELQYVADKQLWTRYAVIQWRICFYRRSYMNDTVLKGKKLKPHVALCFDHPAQMIDILQKVGLLAVSQEFMFKVNKQAQSTELYEIENKKAIQALKLLDLTGLADYRVERVAGKPKIVKFKKTKNKAQNTKKIQIFPVQSSSDFKNF